MYEGSLPRLEGDSALVFLTATVLRKQAWEM